MGKDGPDYSNVATGGEVNVTHPMHASQHEQGGSDEISVEGLSGELADAQDAKAHLLGSATHTEDTLANLNAKVSDATLDDASATRTPAGHKTSHAGGGADKLKYTRQALFYLPGSLAIGQQIGATIIYRGPAATNIRADAHVLVAPTDDDLILDIEVDEVSIWASTPANRVTILDGDTTGIQTSFDTTTINDGDEIQAYVKDVGDTEPGETVTILLEWECNLETD